MGANTPNIRFQGFTDDWEQRKLGDYVTIISGDAPSKFDFGNELYVKVDDLNYNPKYITDSQSKVAIHKSINKAPKGSVVFPKRGAAIMTNKVRILAENSYIDTNMMALSSDRIDSEFLYNAILKEGLYRIADTSTIPQINNKHIEPYEILLPELDEQIRIGGFFKDIDNLITLHQRKCNEVKELKKYMLKKMFPQEGQFVPEIRLAGFTDDWEQRKLKDVVTEIKRTDENSDAPVMMITAENGFINQSDRYSTNNAGQSLKKYILLEKGELAYNHGASKLRPYGSCFALTTTEKARIPFVYHCFTTVLENPEFLSIVLNGKAVEKQLRRIVSSGARMDGLLNISFEQYTSIPVLLPKKAEQDRITIYFRNLDNLITLHQRKCDEMKELKKYMLQNMFPQKG